MGVVVKGKRGGSARCRTGHCALGLAVGTLVGVGIGSPLAAQQMDEALRERDMGQVLKLLQGEASPAAPTPAPEIAESPAPVPAPPSAVTSAPPSVAAPAPAPPAVGTPRPGLTRVTVVSSDGSIRELRPEAPSFVTAPTEAPASAPERPARSAGPSQVGPRPAVTAVPKMSPGRSAVAPTAAAPARRVPPAAAEAKPAPEPEVVLPENQSRTRAYSLLTEVTEKPGVVQTESLIPAETPEPAAPDTPEAADAEGPAQPLGLLDQLAQRLAGAPGTEAATPTASASVSAGSSAVAPSPAAAAVAEDALLQLRRDLDQLLGASKTDLGLGSAGAAPSADAGGWRYNGQWRNGKMDGRGTLLYPDGWKFEGDWREGRISGKGVLHFADGSLYDGEWADGKMDGLGSLTFPDGWKYVGQWRAGRMHGSGELIHPRAAAPKTP